MTIHQAPAVSKRVDQIGSNPSGSVSGGSAGGSGKKGDRIWDLPKSRAVKKLEGILGNLKSLQAGEGKVKVEEGREECFCQGEWRYLCICSFSRAPDRPYTTWLFTIDTRQKR